MKKVILLSPAHPYRGGIAASSERLAQELQQEGLEVEIITFTLQYPSFLFPGKTQFTDDPPPPGLHIERRLNAVNPVSWWLLGRELRRRRPDLILTRFWIPFIGPSIGTVIRLARRNGHTKAICIADNVIPHESRPGDRFLTRYLLQSMDGFVVMSRSVGADLDRFAVKAPYRYAPHPLYDNYGQPTDRAAALQTLGLDPGFRYLLFFGFIRDYKGLDLLLEAMADPRIQALPVKLIVAGEYYGNQEKYEAQIAALGIQDQLVLHTKYIPHEEVRHFFGASDLVVQTYRSATVSGISQLAYHFEKPMVVTRVGGLPEIVEHGKSGYVVEVAVSAVADAIVDFFEHDRYLEMEAGVRSEKKRFSWKHMVDVIREVYEAAG